MGEILGWSIIPIGFANNSFVDELIFGMVFDEVHCFNANFSSADSIDEFPSSNSMLPLFAFTVN